MDQPEDTTWTHPPRDATTTTGGSRDDLCSEETASERIDKALETLKAELVAMRQQDVQLLKQLLHISQNIRRLKHVRCSKSGLGDSSRAARAGQFPAHAQTDVFARSGSRRSVEATVSAAASERMRNGPSFASGHLHIKYR
ncbi:uncharacterized protein LOC112567168 [Pomacea canaliculata]|uniref:uncharacterized protein LOC112567168 n=1 Tax=Pomacea canaliculata TaxID=400727 RepID=UPI000D72E051|nr:uncharacterized protein LOC112567168 [Pomacea canaliculata]